jgi:streptomycin 6-kinase
MTTNDKQRTTIELSLALPSAFVKNVSQAFPDGAQWLAKLPGLLDEAARRWKLTLGEPFLLSYNYVCAATLADGTPAVLKIGVPNRELTSEIAALRLYAGQGACKLYQADPEVGLLLLERLEPGTMLHEHADDDAQTAIAANVMKRLWRPAPEGEPLITLKSWFDELRHLRLRFYGGTGPFPKKLLETAEGLIRELFAETSPAVVLHGDCHHFNILLSQRGWLVIDPKGVVGAAEYEPAPLLMNPWDTFVKFPYTVETAERRIAILSEILGFDRKRLHAWAVAHSVLSAWWDMQEDGTGGEYSIACGEIFLNAEI